MKFVLIWKSCLFASTVHIIYILHRVVDIYNSEDRSAVVKVNKVLYPVYECLVYIR